MAKIMRKKKQKNNKIRIKIFNVEKKFIFVKVWKL